MFELNYQTYFKVQFKPISSYDKFLIKIIFLIVISQIRNFNEDQNYIKNLYYLILIFYI